MVKRVAGAALAALCLTAVPLAARPYDVDDLLRHEDIGSVRVDPTGRWLAFEKREALLAMARQDRLTRSDALRSRPYLVDLKRGGPALPLLRDDVRPGAVVLGFSPGGRHLAIARLDGDRFRLGVVTMSSGAVRWWPVAPSYDPFHKIFAWASEDRLLLIAEPDDHPPPWLTTDIAPDLLTRARWDATASGHLAVTTTGSGRYLRGASSPLRRLLLIDVSSDRTRTLAEGRWRALRLSPDAKRVALVGDGDALQPTAGSPVHEDDMSFATSLRLVDLGSGTQWQPCPGCVIAGEPVWDDRSRRIAFAVERNGAITPMVADVVRRQVRAVSASELADPDTACDLDSPQAPFAASHSVDGAGLATLRAPIRCTTHARNEDRSSWIPLRGTNAMSSGRTPALVERMALGSRATLVRIHEVGGDERLYLDRAGTTRLLMALNIHMAGVVPAIMQPLYRLSTDGRPLVDWLFLPPAPNGPAALPLVVIPYPGLVYGAQPPADQLVGGERPHANAQLLAAAGFAVLLPSMPMPARLPDDGYDFAALVAPAIDAAVRSGCCDGRRIGLWGHSYGGYAAAMMNAQSTRFGAVAVSAGIYDLAGTVGTFGPSGRTMPERGVPIASSYAWAEDGQGRMGAPPWIAPARYRANSPVWIADRMHAPMSIVGADRDVSPLGQAEQLFSALFRQGKDAELVTYWGEGHVVASPANLRDLYGRVIGFFREWLDRPQPHAGR